MSIQQSQYSGGYSNGGGSLFALASTAHVVSGTGTTNYTLNSFNLGTSSAQPCLVIAEFNNWNAPGVPQVPIATVTDSLGNTLALGVTNANAYGAVAKRVQINWIVIPGGVPSTYNVNFNITGGPTGATVGCAVSVFNSTVAISGFISNQSTNGAYNTSIAAGATTYCPISTLDYNTWVFATASVMSLGGNNILALAGQPTTARWARLDGNSSSAGVVMAYYNSNTGQVLGSGPPGILQIPFVNNSGSTDNIIAAAMSLTHY